MHADDRSAPKSFEDLVLRRSADDPDVEHDPAIFGELCARKQYMHLSTAQLFQDAMVALFLRGKRDGFFVEFGAANGVTLSNSYVLESRLRWRGILAEPARCWHEQLKANRTAVIDDRCVLNVSGQSLTFFESSVAELSTLCGLRTRDFNRAGRRAGRTYDVQTVSLNDLLTGHGAPPDIDYLSIDTEGSEFAILDAFDFDRYDVKIITVEHNYCEPDRTRIFDLLTSHDFVRVLEPFSRFDDWYVQDTVLDNLSP